MQSVVGSCALDMYHRAHSSDQNIVQAPLVNLGMDPIAKELLLSRLTSLIESIVDEICTEKKDGKVVIHSKLLSTTNCFVQIAFQVMYIGLKSGLPVKKEREVKDCPYKVTILTTLNPLLQEMLCMERYANTLVPELMHKIFHSLTQLVYARLFEDVKNGSYCGKESNTIGLFEEGAEKLLSTIQDYINIMSFKIDISSKSILLFVAHYMVYQKIDQYNLRVLNVVFEESQTQASDAPSELDLDIEKIIEQHLASLLSD